MNSKSDSLARLKRRIDALARPVRSSSGAGLFALGHEGLDARLGGGLARGGLHEVLGSEPVAASGLALMFALRAAPPDKPILWVLTDREACQAGRLYGPGLAELGADPDRFVLVCAPDEVAALKAGADIIGCAEIGAAILDAGPAKKLDLTASRRLALAGQASGVTSIVIRAPGTAIASAASTRWAVSSAPSMPLPGDAPGRTAFRLELLRHRGGIPPFDMLLEWNHGQQSFSPYPPLLRDLPAAPERRQMAA